MINIDRIVLSPLEIMMEVAKNAASKRKIMKISQKELAARSGVSYASIRRFEKTGEISFKSLVLIANVLDARDDVLALFQKVYYHSLEDVRNEKRFRT